MSQWQKDFNSISEDIREDEETKTELLLRLDVCKFYIIMLQYIHIHMVIIIVVCKELKNEIIKYM